MSAGVSPPSAGAAASRTTTSRTRSPSAQTSIGQRIVRSERGRRRATRAAQDLPARRRRRGVGRDRRRQPPTTDRAPARTAAGPGGVRERAVLPRAPRPRAGIRHPSRLAFRPRAHLRIPLPERAHVRGLPADVRRTRGGVHGVRREPGGEAPVSGCRPLQGLGLLLDGLRPQGAESRREGGGGLG